MIRLTFDAVEVQRDVLGRPKKRLNVDVGEPKKDLKCQTKKYGFFFMKLGVNSLIQKTKLSAYCIVNTYV